MWLLQNNKYVDIHLPGWAVCVLIMRLTNNIHQHRFACMLTSTKAFLYEVTFCSPLKTGDRLSGCWSLRKEMIFLDEIMLCVHTVVSSCLVCFRAAQTIHLLVVNLMAQYWRSAKEQKYFTLMSTWQISRFHETDISIANKSLRRFRWPNSLSNTALSTVKQRHGFLCEGILIGLVFRWSRYVGFGRILCEISMVSSDKWPRLYQSCQNTKVVKYTRVSGWMGFLYPWGKFIIQALITSSSFWKHISRVLTNSLNFLPSQWCRQPWEGVSAKNRSCLLYQRADCLVKEQLHNSSLGK